MRRLISPRVNHRQSSRSSLPRATGVEALEGRVFLAVQPAADPPGAFPPEQLVADINRGTLSSNPYGTVVVDGVAYFFATSHPLQQFPVFPNASFGLWRSDGTQAGTRLLKPLFSGQSSIPQPFEIYQPVGVIVSGRRMYFASPRQSGGPWDVWTSDGTETGTINLGVPIHAPLVTDRTGLTRREFTEIVGDNGNAYWVSMPAGGQAELWTSDGTVAGTRRLRTFAAVPTSLTMVNGTLFFAAGAAEDTGLWKSDGTQAGTVLVKSMAYPSVFADVGGTLFFTADSDSQLGGEMWKSDGTESGTVLVSATGPSSQSRVFEIEGLNGVAHAAVGELLFPSGHVASELWRSDGTPQGTSLLVRTTASDLEALNGRLYFRGYGAGGEEPWTSDGTAPGTYRLADINPGSSSSVSGGFERAAVPSGPGAGVYFRAWDGNGDALWRTDGTPAGTVPVVETPPGMPKGTIGSLVPTGDGQLFFSGDLDEFGQELRITDGTPEGTRLAVDVSRSPQHSNPAGFTSFGSAVLFFATPELGLPSALYRTGGTPGGTVLLKEGVNGMPGTFVEMGGVLYFAGAGGMWRTDGTAAGTVLVADRFGTSQFPPVRAGDRLYFISHDLDHGTELWKTDGTQQGTVLVKDINPGRNSAVLGELTALGDTVYVVANDGVNGPELWRSDGTEAGTVMVRAIDPRTDGAGPRPLATVNGTLYFGAYDGTRFGLWRSDGTFEGTQLLTHLADGTSNTARAKIINADGTIFVAAGGANGTGGIYRSDGTAAGTARFADDRVSDQLGHVGNRLLFPRYDAEHGTELWISDGSPQGTRLLKDLSPGTGASSFGGFYSVPGGVTYFFAQGTSLPTDDEIWRTDGTPEGTYEVTDLEPPDVAPVPPGTPTIAFSEPRGFFLAPDGSLYFAATTASYGREPWRIPPAGPNALPGGATVSHRGLFYNGTPAAAPDKRALLPGEGGGSFANVSSYTGGLNGINVDVAGLRPGASLSAADFAFDVGPGGAGGAWSEAPAPAAVSLNPGAGENGSARVTLTWPDGAIRNQWLRVTARANDRTGLTAPHVFYFGSLVGEAGDVSSPLRVSALDLAAVKRALNTSAAPDSPYDINRDGRVNALDLAAVRASLGRSLLPITPAAPIAPAALTTAALAAPPPWDDSRRERPR